MVGLLIELPIIDAIDLAWLAGLLEGEGYFAINKDKSNSGKIYYSPRIELVMTDLDVIEKVANLTSRKIRIQPAKDNKKESYRITICGKFAIELMQSIKPYMGDRRSNKIEEIFSFWKENTAYAYKNWSCSKDTVKSKKGVVNV